MTARKMEARINRNEAEIDFCDSRLSSYRNSILKVKNDIKQLSEQLNGQIVMPL